MIIVIEGAEVYEPEAQGCSTIVILGDKIASVGKGSPIEWDRLDVGVQHIDGRGMIAIPGLIDPHEHLIGGSGESGFATQTPEIFLQELVYAGITTVVGCLGVDTTTRTMPALLAKAKGLRQQHISAFCGAEGIRYHQRLLPELSSPICSMWRRSSVRGRWQSRIIVRLSLPRRSLHAL